jgi:hypothetical protein
VKGNDTFVPFKAIFYSLNTYLAACKSITVLSPSKVGTGEQAENWAGKPDKEAYPAPPHDFRQTSTASNAFSDKIALKPANKW